MKFKAILRKLASSAKFTVFTAANCILILSITKFTREEEFKNVPGQNLKGIPQLDTLFLDFSRKNIRFEEDSLVFDSTVYKGDEFSNCVFNKGADFEIKAYNKGFKDFHNHYLDTLNFKWSRLSGISEFKNSRFETVVFSGCVINGFTTSESTSQGFVSNNGGKCLTFTNSVIDGFADFSNSQFRAPSEFSQMSFSKSVSFEGAEIHRNLDFRLVFFNQNLLFKNAKISDSSTISFEDCALADTLDFSFAKLGMNIIDLKRASYEGGRLDTITRSYNKHYLNLYKTDPGKFNLNYQYFTLLTTYEKDYYFQSHRKVKTEDVPFDEMCSIYESLLNSFKTKGQMQSYRLLDTEYRSYRWQDSTTPWMSFVERNWWDYGYNKALIFRWTLIFLLLFTFGTFFRLSKLLATYPVSSIPEQQDNAFALSVSEMARRYWYSLVFTSTLFFGLTLKFENINFTKKSATVYIVLVYVIGIVCLAYMANYIIQK